MVNKGWFVKIDSDPSKSRVFYNGEIVKYVQKIEIEANPKQVKPVLTLTILGMDIQAEIHASRATVKTEQ